MINDPELERSCSQFQELSEKRARAEQGEAAERDRFLQTEVKNG